MLSPPPAPVTTDDLALDLARAERLLRARVGDQASGASPGASPAAGPGCRSAALRRCAEIFNLTGAELDVVLLALAVELDERFGDLIARVHGDPARRRPSVASLLSVLARAPGEPATRETLAAGGHLVRTGLIELSGDGPHPDRVVRVPDAFWPRLAGMAAPAPFSLVAAGADALSRLVLAGTTCAQIDELVARGAREPGHRAWIELSGPPGSGRDSLAEAIAGRLGFACLRIDAAAAERADTTPHLAREAAWNLAAVIVHGTPSAPAAARLAQEVSTPILVISADAAPPQPAPPARWRAQVAIDPLDADGRERLWRERLAGAALRDDVDLRALAARVPVGPGRVVAAAAIARRSAAARGEPVSLRDLRIACRPGGTRVAGGLAHRLEGEIALDELVVPPATRRELELALTWARRAPSVFHPTGSGRRLRGGPGLVCLFHGPPGTGKTMAAQVVASAIGADLLRVDLSQVVNKYIGETEKNLDRVFEEAEESGAVLFFDEADALFARRSEVKDAHDRYANLETAFLLQRLELHRGICILASNLRQNVDDAFSRRIQILAEFPMPGREERRRIWALQLPAEHLAPDVDLAALADRAAISGGDIRNAAATAALMAAADGGLITMAQLVVATWRELRKSGRLIAADEFGPWQQAILRYSGSGPAGAGRDPAGAGRDPAGAAR
ncbi:MAG TPA: AAA family ATPase [Kofleriaceae bacterium]|nr:AAA family ATPase [Kofleriaceae bacterium]